MWLHCVTYCPRCMPVHTSLFYNKHNMNIINQFTEIVCMYVSVHLIFKLRIISFKKHATNFLYIVFRLTFIFILPIFSFKHDNAFYYNLNTTLIHTSSNNEWIRAYTKGAFSIKFSQPNTHPQLMNHLPFVNFFTQITNEI